jgi:hypothetical protein
MDQLSIEYAELAESGEQVEFALLQLNRMVHSLR